MTSASKSVSTVAIVGAGVAGATVAEELRDLGYTGRVTLFGGEPYPPYDRPPLSKSLAEGGLSPSNLAINPESFYRDREVDLLVGVTVDRIDPADGRFELLLGGGGKLSADAVVLATGAVPRRMSVEQASGAVHYLRTLDDALAIREGLGSAAHLGIVGAGLIGGELASVATAMGVHATLIDPVERPLERQLGRRAAAHLRRGHEAAGVSFICGATVASVLTDASTNGSVLELSSGECLEFGMVVAAIGSVPNCAPAGHLSIATVDGIRVDDHGRTAIAGLYAVGDVTATWDPTAQRWIRSEHWHAARAGAGEVARAITGSPNRPADVPWFWTLQAGSSVQVLGSIYGADRVVTVGEPASGSFSELFVRDGVAVGGTAVNRAADLRLMRELVMSGEPIVERTRVLGGMDEARALRC